MNKIELHFTTVNNPKSNSPIERWHSSIIEKLRVLRIKNPNELPGNLMISAVQIYNQSIHASTGYSPFHLLYGPYDRMIEFDLDLTVYEQYNEKRKQEIIPFYDQVYLKNKNKADRNLDKRNETRDDPPNITVAEVYVERERPRKIDPPFEKITIDNQQGNKLLGRTQTNRQTTADISKVKRLRKYYENISLQRDDNPDASDEESSGIPNNPNS